MRNASQRFEKVIKSALNMLALQDYTEKTLRRKLRMRWKDPEAVDLAVKYVIEKGFLDEKRFLERFVEYHALTKRRSKKAITKEVFIKGFSQDVIKENYSDMLLKYDFNEIALESAKASGKSDKQKLYAFLVRKGFVSPEISYAISILEESGKLTSALSESDLDNIDDYDFEDSEDSEEFEQSE